MPKMNPFHFWVKILFFGFFLSVIHCDSLDSGSCEPIKVDMCRHIGYNKTAMPNLAGHNLQADAKFDLETFSPLIQSGCSKELQFFLCFAYVPMCVTEVTSQRLIGPCRPLCERVKKSCLSLLEQFQYPWPSSLNCSKFPESNNHYHMCMEGPGESNVPLSLPPSSFHTLQTNPLFMQKVKQQLADGTKPDLPDKVQKNFVNYIQMLESNFDQQKPAKSINIHCNHFKKSSQYHYVSRMDTCIPICQSDIIFTKEEKNFGNQLIVGLSSCGLAISLLSFFTLLIDGALSERTLSDLVRKSSLFLAMACSGLFGSLIFSRFFRADDLCIRNNDKEPILLSAQEGHRNQPCTIIFLFLYFFGTAVGNWFTSILCQWCLASAKVSKSVVSTTTLSILSHAYGWGVPAILTIIAIVTHQVESDEYSSVCLPGGSHNDPSFLTFIVVPQGIQFVLGILFGTTGVTLSLVKLNDKTPPPSQTRKKPTELQIRNWTMNYIIFALIYMLSLGCVWGIHVYEYRYRSRWYESSQAYMPDSQMFAFRLVMTFLMGMSPFVLIINREAVTAWKKLICGSFLLRIWSRDKQRTPDYPRVAYQPQAVMENQIHLGADYHRGQNL